MNYKDYLATEKFPTTWCSGCSLETVLKETAQVFSELKLKKKIWPLSPALDVPAEFPVIFP